MALGQDATPLIEAYLTFRLDGVMGSEKSQYRKDHLVVWKSSSCVLAVGRLRVLQGDTIFPLCTCALRCVLSTDVGADKAAQRSVQNPSHLWE